MIIAKADEIRTNGLFDIREKTEVTVNLFKVGKIDSKIYWEPAESGKRNEVPKKALLYDDTPDISKTAYKSWSIFFNKKQSFQKSNVYSGCPSFFSHGRILWAQVSLCALYMRYSDAFCEWLSAFDKEAVEKIINEKPLFQDIVNRLKKSKTKNEDEGEEESNDEKSEKSNKKKEKSPFFDGGPENLKSSDDWNLPVLAVLSSGKLIVFGIAEDVPELAEMGIDVKRSLEFAGFLKKGTTKIVSEKYQLGSGLGKNVFGETYEGNEEIPECEYIRLLGYHPHHSPKEIREVIHDNTLTYPVKVLPMPDSSFLLYMPESSGNPQENSSKYKMLKDFVENENRLRELSKESKNKNKKLDDEVPEQNIRPSDEIPIYQKCTLYLCNQAGTNHPKIVIQQVFPSVELKYLKALNAELLGSKTFESVFLYMRKAITGRDSSTSGKSPSAAYQYWTEIFSCALNKEFFSAEYVFYYFQKYCQVFGEKELQEECRREKKHINYYWDIIRKLLRLQHLIYTARTNPEGLSRNQFYLELEEIEQLKRKSKGVFSEMNEKTARELLGEHVYDQLSMYQQKQIDEIVLLASAGIPKQNIETFMHGILTGMLLKQLHYAVTNAANRSFSLTGGKRPSCMRGRDIMSIFKNGIDKLILSGKFGGFNINLLPLIESYLTESEDDVFNDGFIAGLVYWGSKEDNNSKEKEDKND